MNERNSGRENRDFSGRDGSARSFGQRRSSDDSIKRHAPGDRFGRGIGRGGNAGSGQGRGGRDNRENSASGRAEQQNYERPAWQQRVARPIDPNKPKSPPIPEEITEKDLELGIRVQLKTLSAENAERVARHLAMVSILADQDPELAHRHAMAAAERAGRIAIVRETVGVTAYAVGDYALALRELTTFRRISGSNDQLPIMVDSERGLGRPKKALELGRAVDRSSLSPDVRVNLAIAMSGARLDLGENEAALAELQIPELNPERVFDYSASLFYAYSDTCEILGRTAEAKQWLKLAQRAEAAIEAKYAPDEEVFEVIEEIEIPVLPERTEFSERSRDSYQGRSDDRREPRAPSRAGYGSTSRDGDRPVRRDGDRPVRRDGDRPVRRDGDRPYNRDSSSSTRDSSESSSSRSSSAPRRPREGSRNRDFGSGESPKRGKRD